MGNVGQDILCLWVQRHIATSSLFHCLRKFLKSVVLVLNPVLEYFDYSKSRWVVTQRVPHRACGNHLNALVIDVVASV